MFHWGLKTKVLLLTLVPTLIIAVLLGSFFINVRLDELDNTVKDRGYLTVQKFLPVIHRQLTDGNIDSLQSITNRMLEEDDVRAVSIIGNTGYNLSHSGPTMWPKSEDYVLYSLPNTPQIHTTSNSLRFVVPVQRVDPLGLRLMPHSHPSTLTNSSSPLPNSAKTTTSEKTKGILSSDTTTPSLDSFEKDKNQFLGWVELEISFVNTLSLI